MSAIVVEDQVEIRLDDHTSQTVAPQDMAPNSNRIEILTETGIWLSGVESFLASGDHSFAAARATSLSADSTREFRLVHLTLQRCSMLNMRLLGPEGRDSAPDAVDHDELAELSRVLRDVTVLSEGLINSTSLGSGEWNAWNNLLNHRLKSLPAYHRLIRSAEETGRKFLPATLNDLVESDNFLTPEHSELALILPRFGVILKWLSVVGRMLEADEPLKPALLIFSRVNEQIFELTSYINNRLERFPNEEAELFSSLDAASYTASIELKKVYSQELAGVAAMRPSPSIYARMETAHSLLSEGFQQILAGFARLLDPQTDIFKLFPNFQTKLDQSIALSSEIVKVVKVVQTAEAKPDKEQIDKMQAALRKFQNGTARYLFYKDTETVERFIEEILVTKQNKDLVPILHRFGAYLETLSGQVRLRAVLELNSAENAT
ncbi:MAG: hypothetical protein ABIV48_03490 [Pyrinomonadaceae bacterium]